MRLSWLLLVALDAVQAVMYDASLDLIGATRFTDSWLGCVILDARNECPDTAVDFVQTPDFFNLHLDDVSQIIRQSSALIVMAHCIRWSGFWSSVELMLAGRPVLSVDLTFCNSRNHGPSGDNQLETFRLEHDTRPLCVHWVLKEWMRNQVCPFRNPSDRNLTDGSSPPFSPSVALQQCSGRSQHQWLSSFHSTGVAIPEAFIKRFLNVRKIRIIAIEEKPFVYLPGGATDLATGPATGYAFEFINVLSRLYNFTYTIESPHDNTYGVRLADGSWSGMIGLLANSDRVYDLAVGGLSITHDRFQMVDFTVPIAEEKSAILIPAPTEQMKMFACFKPFGKKVWWSLMAVLAVLPLVLWFNWRLYSARSNGWCPSVGSQYMRVLGVLLSQSGQALPRMSPSAALLGWTWCLGATILTGVYVGTLVSHLTVPNLRPVVDSLSELPESQMRWAARKGVQLETIFKEAMPNSTEGKIGRALIDNPQWMVDSHSQGLDRVCNGSWVYIESKVLLEYMIYKEKNVSRCHLRLAKKKFNHNPLGFAVPKSSSYLPTLNLRILQMKEAGLTEQWFDEYFDVHHLKSKHMTLSKHRRLALEDLHSAFLVLIVGVALASVVLLVEVGVHCVVRRK